jgi:hypothetical protein
MDCVHYWEVGPWGGGGAPTGLIAPGATHPRYATDVQWRSHGAHGGHVTHVPLHTTSVRPDRVIRANPRRKLGVPRQIPVPGSKVFDGRRYRPTDY